MPYVVNIPKEKKEAEKTVRAMLETAKAKRNPIAIRWWYSRWYMRGVRNFKDLNYNQGSLQVSYYDEKGVLRFQYEDIVAKYQAQKGRLMGVNLRPVVTKEGISLDGMRKASVGQVVLDSVFPVPKVEVIQAEAISTLLLYGTVGLLPWITEGGGTIGIEVAPPWKLLPIPVEVDSPHKIRGLIHRQLIPIEWLQELPGVPAKNSKDWKEMEKMEIPVGMIPPEAKNRFSGSVALGGITDASSSTLTMDTKAGGVAKGPDKTKVKVVEAAEIWTYTEDNYWGEYILYAGGKILSRADHTGEKRQFPPQVISDVDIGDFWGRSYIETLIPLNCEMEGVIARQFQNLKDMDLYGLLMWPTMAGVNMRIQRGSDGTKIVAYEPDPLVPDAKPFNIAPNKTGSLPFQIAKLGAELQNAIAQQPSELMGGGAPGRVDSAQGLGFLYETSNVPLTPTAKALARGFSNCYRVTLDITRRMWDDQKVLDITHLDDNIAGIKLDPSTGRIQLTDNAIPHPDEVIVNVASAVPRSKEQMKMELKESLDKGRLTLTEYNILARKQSLDLPVGNEQEWQNYRRATLENIMLFGDGVKPGKVTVTDHDMHEIHLWVLKPFMARPEYFLASEEVRMEFKNHHDEHMAGLGITPEGLPIMEEAAEMTTMQMEGTGLPSTQSMPG